MAWGKGKQIFTGMTALVLVASALPAWALEKLEVTAYQNGLGLVDEERVLVHGEGTNRIALPGLGRGLIADSLSVSPQSEDVAVVNALTLPDGLGTHDMLTRFVGQTITWADRNPATGKDDRRDGILLSMDNGPVIQFGDRVEMNPPGRPILTKDQFQSLGSRLPQVTLQTRVKGETPARVRYLADGLGWQAVYNATLSDDESRLMLAGEIKLDNHSGRAFEGAKVQVIAGSVNRLSAAPRHQERKLRNRGAGQSLAAFADGGSITAESAQDYWAFTVPYPMDLADDGSIKIPFASARDIRVKKRYVLENQDYGHWYRGPEQTDLRPALRLELKNDADNGLGRPLPEGLFRIYAQNGNQFLGENRLKALAEGERGEVEYGQAFDISAHRKQLDFEKLGPSRKDNNFETPYETTYETTYEITLRNARPAGVVVEVIESFNGEWRILEESARHVKKDAFRAVWSVAVPAKGETVLRYKVRVEQ